MSLDDIANEYNPVLRGWLNYYGRYYPSSMLPVLTHFNKTLVAWAMHKFKKMKGHKTKASVFIKGVAERQPKLFVHWEKGMVGGFA